MKFILQINTCSIDMIYWEAAEEVIITLKITSQKKNG